MISYASLGMRPDYRLYAALKNATREVPELVFTGYGGTYYYKNFGYAEFSIAEVENEKGEKELTGFGAHLMGYHNYRMRVRNLLYKGDMRCSSLCSPENDNSILIPVSFVLSDVLPSILPGDSIVFQGVAYLYSGRFYSSLDEADSDITCVEQRETTGAELGKSSGLIFFTGDDPSSSIPVVPLFTKVHSFKRYPSYFQVGRNLSSACSEPSFIYTVEADLPFGEVTIAVPDYYFTPLIISRLENNMDVFLYGYIHYSGDPAIEEYQKGAIFDETHLLRVLREALETGDLNRLGKNMIPECEYYGSNGRRLTGRKEIIMKMRDVIDAQNESRNYKQHHAAARITEVIDSDKAEYSVGKECLVSYSLISNGRAENLIFIEVENGKISAMKFIYDSCYEFKVDWNTYIPAGMPVFMDLKRPRD